MLHIKFIIAFILSCTVVFAVQSQDIAQNEISKQQQKASALAYQANTLQTESNYVAAEKAYRKALSANPDYAKGSYNLAHSYYKNGHLNEALFRLQETIKTATTKEEKHRTFHNIGNILMKEKRCKEAVEAYKNALRNDPTDDESRYNLGLAKECAKEENKNNNDKNNKDNQQNKENKKDQKDQGKDNNKKQDDKSDQEKKEGDDQKDKNGKPKNNKDQEDQKKDNEQKQDDKGDQKKKEGDDQKDENGKPKNNNDQSKPNETDNNKNQPGNLQPKQGQLSPQQVKNLLEALSNHEEKVQEKINAKAQKGVKIKTEKDW